MRRHKQHLLRILQRLSAGGLPDDHERVNHLLDVLVSVFVAPVDDGGRELRGASLALHPGEVLGVVNMVFVKSTKEAVLAQPSGITYAVPANHLDALLRSSAISAIRHAA